MRKAIFLGAILVGIFSACQKGQSPHKEPADFLIRYARIYTVDAQRPWAEAMAVKGDQKLPGGNPATGVRVCQKASRTEMDRSGGMELLCIPTRETANRQRSGRTNGRAPSLLGCLRLPHYLDEPRSLKRVRDYAQDAECDLRRKGGQGPKG